MDREDETVSAGEVPVDGDISEPGVGNDCRHPGRTPHIDLEGEQAAPAK
jgi:hypothetical protein